MIRYRLTGQLQQEFLLLGFEVERSVDGLHYSSVHSLIMNNIKDVYFTYTDNALPSSSTIIYYRLKMLHETREVSYSAVKKVEVVNRTIKVSLYPNPCMNNVSVSLPNGFAHSLNKD